MGRRWKFADQYQPQLDRLGPSRMLILRHVGVSPFTFDALDRYGRLHLIWILDHARIEHDIASGPQAFTVRDWQRDGLGKDLADVALSGGAPQ